MFERAFTEIYLKVDEIDNLRMPIQKLIMSSYNLVNGKHVNEDAGIINNISRKEIHFHNIVMTDWIYADLNTNDSGYKNKECSPYEIIKSSVVVFIPDNKDFYDDVLKAVKENK